MTERLLRGKQSEVCDYIEGPIADAQHPYFDQNMLSCIVPKMDNLVVS